MGQVDIWVIGSRSRSQQEKLSHHLFLQIDVELQLAITLVLYKIEA